ncbi:hypothetical protein [Rhizobium leguminosarum]
MGANSTRNRKRMLQESLKASRPEHMVHPEERLLPAEFREKLRKNGLVGGALPLFVSNHASYPSGYVISLPEASGGNTLCEYEAYTRDDEGHDQLTRMPSLTLWGKTGNWNVSVWEWVPGPGPGDFTKKQMSLDEALETIRSYFFDPNNEHFKQAELALQERMLGRR